MKSFTVEQLEARRKQICKSMAAIKTMRAGTLNEFYRHPKRKDGTRGTNGPFYSITAKKNNKTITISVPRRDLKLVRREVENYKSFRKLCDAYIDVCEQISLLTYPRKK